MPPKITVLAEDCWIIRSTRPGRVFYYEAQNVWNRSPAQATIYRSLEAAQNDVWNYLKHVGRLGDEVLEAVPLYGALTGA